jgi:Helicase associated domain
MRKHHNKLEKMVRWKRSQEMASGASVAGNDVAIHAVKQEEDIEWNTMFELLKRFKNAEGHCHADRVTSDPSLGRWGESNRVESLCKGAMSCFAIMG